jgi:hypothetical protein
LGKGLQSLKQFFRPIGRFGITIILSVALLFIGGAGGFYLALFLQKVSLETKLNALVPAAIAFAVLGWIGSGADILGLLREMYKEYQKERKIPEVTIDDKISKEEDAREGNGGKTHDLKYYLRVKNIRSGQVTSCSCLMNVMGIDEIYPIWKSNKKTHQDISIEDKLFLFETSEFIASDGTITEKQIIFNSYHTTTLEASIIPITKPYSDFENKELEIKFGAAYGRHPKEDYKKKISEIVQNAE